MCAKSEKLLLRMMACKDIVASVASSGGISETDLPVSDSVFGINFGADSDAGIDSDSGVDSGADSVVESGADSRSETGIGSGVDSGIDSRIAIGSEIRT